MTIARIMQLASAGGVEKSGVSNYNVRQSGTGSTIDSNVAEGDILVSAFASPSATSATVPSGYNEVVATTNFESTGEAFVVMYKLLDGTEGGSTIPSPFSGASDVNVRTSIIRAYPSIPTSLALSDLQQATSTTSTTLTTTIDSVDGPCIVYHCGFSFDGASINRNVTRSADQNLVNGGNTAGWGVNAFDTISGYYSTTSGGSQEVTYSGTSANFNMVTFLLFLQGTFPITSEYSFNTEGTDGGLEVASVTNSDFGTGDFTYEAWVYPTDLSNNWNAVVGHTWAAGGGLFYVRGDGAVTFYDGSAILDVGVGTISTNQWYHIAAVRSSGTLTLYIDGASVGSTSYTNSITDTNLYVGQNQSDGEEFQGYIYKPHVLDSAKYTGNFNPSTNYSTEATSLILLTTDGSTVTDLEGNSVTNNGATFILTSP